MDKPAILIATPAYGAAVKLQTLSSILQTTRSLDRAGVKYGFLGTAHADIAAARNFLASFVHERPEYSHLLFIDADMGFAPAAVERLIAAAKPVIGCIAPRRTIDLGTLTAAAARGAPASAATAAALSFAVRHLATTTRLDIRNGLCQVRGVGMALTLIERSALSQLIDHGQVSRYDRHPFPAEGLKGALYGFFDPLRDPADTLLSEDFSFCERWITTCGGEVWALASEPVDHIGDFSYRASYLDHLAARAGERHPPA